MTIGMVIFQKSQTENLLEHPVLSLNCVVDIINTKVSIVFHVPSELKSKTFSLISCLDIDVSCDVSSCGRNVREAKGHQIMVAVYGPTLNCADFTQLITHFGSESVIILVFPAETLKGNGNTVTPFSEPNVNFKTYAHVTLAGEVVSDLVSSLRSGKKVLCDIERNVEPINATDGTPSTVNHFGPPITLYLIVILILVVICSCCVTFTYLVARR